MFSANEIIGNYRIIRPIGEGGMAAVYEVEHLKLGVHYALKTFTLQEGHVELFRKRFSAEGKILARLNHPNLVRVIDLDLDEKAGALYYVMDLVLSEDGETHTLADVKPGEADEAQILGWFRQMCSALAYVHSQGIVHRDVKLNNILLAPDGRVVLSDFGISKVSDENLRSAVDVTKTMVTGMTQGRGVAMGTQGYMAPEVCRGEEATPAADVYSLGVAFFRLLTNVWYDPCLAPSADSGDVEIPSSVTSIEGWAFTGRRKLTSVTIPQGVTNIGRTAFRWCSGLKSITIPPAVTRLDSNVFRDCSGLTSVVIPSNVTSIGFCAFWKCSGLKSVTIPSSVTNIRGNAFGCCGELTSLTMFGECPNSSNNLFLNCRKLKSIHVPANCKSWAGMKEWQGIPLVFDAR